MNSNLINLIKTLKTLNKTPDIIYGALEDSQKEHVEIPQDKEIYVSCEDRRLYVWQNVPNEIIDFVKNTMGGTGPSGNWIYEAGGYQGWHTNGNVLGQRLYVSWAEKEAQSGMKFYIDQQIIDSPDYAGWNIRLFTPPVWHSVYSNCKRLSVGFIFKQPVDIDYLLPIKV